MPSPTWPWCARPRPTRSSPPSRRCPALHGREGRAFIERQHARAAEGDGFSFVIAHEVDPEVGLGSIGLWLQEIESGRASIGYWLVAGARGQGLAAARARAVVSFAFGELAVPRLHLFVEPWNVASARTAEAAGFSREATLRGWERIDGEQHDADCFALLRAEWTPAAEAKRRSGGTSARLPGCSGTITGTEDIAERIDRLMTAVFVADDTERLERLTRDLSSAFVYVSPEAVFEGAAGLSEAFARFRHEPHWHTSLRRTSPMDLHHGYFRYSWARSERGVIALEGWSFGSLDAEGSISRVVTFEGLVPGPPAGRS